MTAKKLTNLKDKIHNEPIKSRLDKTSVPFRLCIAHSLDNNFCIKNLDIQSIKEFARFIDDTVGKSLSISEVDKLFLRTKGTIVEHQIYKDTQRNIFHYGKDRKTFRIHGYYNEHGYFVIVKIDPKHKVHKN